MATTPFGGPSPDLANQPHLVSLVLQSKKALQRGEQLCTRAHVSHNASTQAAVDILALDAKVRWIGKAVMKQLKLAANVAKVIEEKRSHLTRQTDEWDVARAKHADALDDILESLGSHLVPPEFHQTSAESSLFGSQVSSSVPSDPIKPVNGHGSSSANGGPKSALGTASPLATLRQRNMVAPFAEDNNISTPLSERRTWKTLRDFVDDQAIEDVLDAIESDRIALDAVLSKTDDYPERLTRTITSIQENLPFHELTDSSGVTPTLKHLQQVVTDQERTVTSMATLLESLATHYEGMAAALNETESGEAFSEEDMQIMNRDGEELPGILAELEDSAQEVDKYYQELSNAREGSQKDLDYLAQVLDDLDELSDILTEMLETQEAVEVQAVEDLNALRQHLSTLEHLHDRFVSYRMAFNKLVLEIARRRHYRESAENLVKGMMRKLDSMTEEENKVRMHFNAEYGLHLPEDLCLCIGNAPTQWEIVPLEGTSQEFLPALDNDLVNEARERVGLVEGAPGAESL